MISLWEHFEKLEKLNVNFENLFKYGIRRYSDKILKNVKKSLIRKNAWEDF